MKVNLNGLRVRLCRNYNSVVNILGEWAADERIDEDMVDEIKTALDDLRVTTAVLACVYEEGNDEFRDVSDEIEIKLFNEELDDVH